MAVETIASFSDLLLSFLSPSKPLPSTLPPPSPSTLKLPPRSSTKLILKAEHDDGAAAAVISRLAYPSLANANLLFFKSGNYNVEIVPKDGESEEQLVNDFRRSVFRAGVLQECRRRRFFESSLEKKKRKSKEAAKKNRKRRPIPKPKPQSNPKSREVKEEEEDDDNWTLPPEDLEIPYTNHS